MFGSLVNRAMYAVRGFIANWNAYTVPSEEYAYNSYDGRQWRYNQALHYYSNTVYSVVNRFAESYKSQNHLYKHIRAIYNPVARLVEFYPGKVYGGSIDYEKLQKGAVPIGMADEALREAIRQVFQWSTWGVHKSLYVRNGALYGDTALKIVDDRDEGRVRLEVLDPRKIKYLEKDDAGCVKRIIIEYLDCDDEAPLTPMGNTSSAAKTYTKTEIIDEEMFRTFKDGQPFAYYEDADGRMVSEWPNEYGFVPVVLTHHKQLGLEYGGSAFHTQVSKIDELNDAASLLNDQVRKAVQTIWWAAGVAKSGDLSPSSEKRDDVPMVYAPAGSQPFPMVAPTDIAAALQNIQEMLGELERDLPELSMHRLREGGNLTAPGVRAAYSDAIDRITDARSNYDDALVRALRMAIAIGGLNRYDKFRPYTLDFYRNGDADFFIADRPVVSDELTEEQTVSYLLQSGAPKGAVWSRLGYDEETVMQWKEESDAQAAAAAVPTPAEAQQSDTPKVSGQKMPSEQATSIDHLTDDHLGNIFDQYQGAKQAAGHG